MKHSRDVIFDESSILEGVSSLSPEEDTQEPNVSADPDDTPAVSEAVPLPPLPRSSHLVPVPPVRADSPVRDDPVSAPEDEVPLQKMRLNEMMVLKNRFL